MQKNNSLKIKVFLICKIFHFSWSTTFNMGLLLQQADLAVADLTITYEREQGVDFTMPFMNLGKWKCC